MPEESNAPSVEQVNAALEKAKQLDALVQGVAALVQDISDIALRAAALIDCLVPQAEAAPAAAPEAAPAADAPAQQ